MAQLKNWRNLLWWVALLLLLSLPAHAARQPYRTNGDCDSHPRIDLATPAGICVGLVTSGLRFPRALLPLESGDLLVVAMGGWIPGKGEIVRLVRTEKGYRHMVLLSGLDRPHGIARGPDGKIYVGVVGGVFRFDLARPANSKEDLIGGSSAVPGLPDSGRHPLVNLVFGSDRNLYVAIGSRSDNCEDDDGSAPDEGGLCAEAEGDNPRGSLRRYRMNWPQGRIAGVDVFARGLRNSMALTIDPRNGRLLQAENSRDAIHLRIAGMKDDANLPHDELNVIHEGGNYGWPYCYDNGVPSPEFPDYDCARSVRPLTLLPPHAAPLGMVFYTGHLLPAPYHGTLMLSYHGYRRHGHRVVFYRIDASGQIVGKQENLIEPWKRTESHPKGAPTDIRMGVDGALYVCEDRNGTVLRISRDRQ